MKEILKKVRLLEVKARRLVENTFAGEYATAFKGQGLEFDELRPYQYGDDVRAIDWKVTAKMGQAYIKTFREEREQTLFVLFDVSGSEDFGAGAENKYTVGTEITALLAFLTLKNSDKIGLATVSDKIETYYPPDKGKKHVLKIVRELLAQENRQQGTKLSTGLTFLRRSLKKRSILFVISDFLDKGFEKPLLQLGRRHELVLIHLYHPGELMKKGKGMLPVIDIESGQMRWVNSSSERYHQRLKEKFFEAEKRIKSLGESTVADYLLINTQEDYIPILVNFFRRRNRKRNKKPKSMGIHTA